jgi:predicted acylesterase/phospholipase RssA
MNQDPTAQPLAKESTATVKQSLFARIARLFYDQEPPAPTTFAPASIGDKKDSVVRVIAFSAGGADNVFEFGMVHAFLVSDAPKPHIVAGTSSGAVVAAMLADVVQSGESEGSGTASRRLAQVARFRSLLEQIQRLPSDFKEASFPDFTEVSARAGLRPLDLPTQQPAEKEDRKFTALARFGLTRLLNGMLSSRTKFREITRITRLILEMQALSEWRWKWLRRVAPLAVAIALEFPVILWLKIWTGFRLWRQTLVPVIRDAPLLTRFVLAPGREWYLRNRFLRAVLEKTGLSRLRDAKTILFEPWYLRLIRTILFLISYPFAAITWLLLPFNLATQVLPSRYKRSAVVRIIGLIVLVLAVRSMIQNRNETSRLWVELRTLGRTLTPDNFYHAYRDWNRISPFLIRTAYFLFDAAMIWFAAGVVSAAAAIVLGWWTDSSRLLARFLDGFGIKKDLLTTGVLRKLLMLAFDPFYFGKRNFSQALNEALGGKPQRTEDRNDLLEGEASLADQPATELIEGECEGQRTLADWIWKKPNEKKERATKDEPLLVAPVAADVATGNLVILEPATATVDALSAACALTPLFAAMDLKLTPSTKDGPAKRWLVDGACVAREPIQPVLDLIKRLNLNRLYPQPPQDQPRPFADLKLAVEPSLIDLCVISPYPTRRLREQERKQMSADMIREPSTASSKDESAEQPINQWDLPGTLYRLSDIFSLQATHSAKDERSLVTLYNAVLKKHQETTGHALFCSSLDQEQTEDISDWHVCANLREFEPKQPIQLMIKLARCPDDTAKRSLLLRTIADGCRASLSGLYRNKLAELAKERLRNELSDGGTRTPVVPPCRKLQDLLIKKRGIKELPGILGKESPPGIMEICKECRFYNEAETSWRDLVEGNAKAAENALPAMPDWGEMTGRETQPLNIEKLVPKTEPDVNWPVNRTIENGELEKGKERPLVSMIFSGGVFRGVFQVGVLNAFCMAGMKPDVVAGASVGTIMAALSARVFTEKNEERRKHRIASVAATFLAIDRLVLTDRFANFIRRFTLRAGSADCSLRDADHLFRQFDRRNWELLARRSRQVLAGIHRLTYMDPLEMLDLLKLIAPHQRQKLPDRFVLYAQDALNRAGIGSELLGAEPLEQLIKAHVLAKSEDHGAEFNEFLNEGGIHFMATTTNLTTGKLDVLGSFCNNLRRPALVPGLLASSAFPAVFRPRMNWELRAGSPGLPEELIDGGIADNLPIIPVYRFLFYAGYNKWLKLRPTADSKTEGPQRARPHLLITASLEPRRQILEGEELKWTAESWPSLKSRVSQLQYNVKVDSHRQTQADIRKILIALEKKSALTKTDITPGFELPDLHVSCVKPEWLCGTFAFHPMLGFKRKRQAESIAHGCASTLAHLSCEQKDNPPDWTPHWWRHLELHDDKVCKRHEGSEIWFDLNPRSANDEGDCCFVKGHKCPFSRSELERVERTVRREPAENGEPLAALGKETISALDQIYRQCGKKKTHRRPEE